MTRTALTLAAVAALSAAGLTFVAAGPTLAAAPTSQPSTQPVDLMNTVCPVSGDKVGDSKLTETYDGKVYHFCCDDCPKAFTKDPSKFAKAVAADPTKYGVKTGA